MPAHGFDRASCTVIARSWLFVPGDAPEKMRKALASSADALILDLEDSVAAASKNAARHYVAAFLNARDSHTPAPQLWVRINPLSSGLAGVDLSAIVAAKPDGIILPKIDGPDELNQLNQCLTPLECSAGLAANTLRVMPIATETPSSIFSIGGYAWNVDRLASLTWGAEDLAAAVSAETNRDEEGNYTPLFELARSLCLAGAAAANVPAIETVYTDFRDTAGLASYARRGRRDGFSGMMAIHPSQVPVINKVFSPTDTEVDYARRVIAVFEAAPGAGVVSLNGRMLDAPHLKLAHRVLSRLRDDVIAETSPQ